MAHAQTSGAVNNVMRRFTDATISGAVVDARFMYYFELVDCPVTEPFAVRIGYTG